MAGTEADLLEFCREAMDTVRAAAPLINAQIEAHQNRVEEERSRLLMELSRVGESALQVKRLQTWTRRMTEAVPGTLLTWRHLFGMAMPEGGATSGHSVAAPPLAPSPGDAAPDAHPDVTVPTGTRRITRSSGSAEGEW